eukprot:5825978-Amphidinium_carterae.2
MSGRAKTIVVYSLSRASLCWRKAHLLGPNSASSNQPPEQEDPHGKGSRPKTWKPSCIALVASVRTRIKAGYALPAKSTTFRGSAATAWPLTWSRDCLASRRACHGDDHL